MQIESVALNKIIPYIRNPRKNENAVEKVASSIQEFGFRQPIVVDAENVIIAGHTRFEAAKRLGLDLVPVHVADGLTEQQVKAYRIADNRVGQEAEWDYDLLKLEMDELDNPELTGFNEDELNSILAEVGEGMSGEEGLTDPDEVPEVPDVPFSVQGDLWELGDHRLLCGDATIEKDVERLMNGQKADMVFTDPPYNVALGMDETPEQAKARNRRTDGLVVSNDKMSNDDFRSFLFEVMSRFFDNTKEGGAFYVTHADSEGYNFRGAMVDSGWMVKQCLIWKKSSLVMGRQDYHWMHEPILYGWKPGAAHKWTADRKQTTILEFDKPSSNKVHPTMKPVDLIQYCIKNNSHNHDLVTDYFLGSGSTLIACQKTRRKCYGMEIDPQYCDVIISRWSEFTGKDDLLLNGKAFKWSERKMKKAA
jgi:DNA modification methylase